MSLEIDCLFAHQLGSTVKTSQTKTCKRRSTFLTSSWSITIPN